MYAIGTFFLGKTISNVFEDGINKLCQIESLSHGTNLKNLFKIYLTGANPNEGGKYDGAGLNQQKVFFLMKDYEMCVEGGFTRDEEGLKIIVKTANYFIPRHIFPRWFAALSGYNAFAKILHARNTLLWRICKIFLGIMSGSLHFFIPSYLTFKYTTDEIKSLKERKILQDDESLYGLAYKMNEPISASRIGYRGILCHALNRELPGRVRACSKSSIGGFVQIILAIALACLINNRIATPYRKAFYIGLILG